MSYFSLNIKWAPVVREGEEDARAIIRAAGGRTFSFGDKEAKHHWWVETLGASEEEYEEMMEALIEKYRSTKIWKRKQRRAILARYAKLHGFTTAATELTLVWR